MQAFDVVWSGGEFVVHIIPFIAGWGTRRAQILRDGLKLLTWGNERKNERSVRTSDCSMVVLCWDGRDGRSVVSARVYESLSSRRGRVLNKEEVKQPAATRRQQGKRGVGVIACRVLVAFGHVFTSRRQFN